MATTPPYTGFSTASVSPFPFYNNPPVSPSAATYNHPFPTQTDPNRPPPPPPLIHGDPHVFPYAATYPCPSDLRPPIALNSACGYSPAAPATYQAPPFSGGYQSCYSSPPAFPHTATYPDPTPTSVYTPTPSFSPKWPPPAPDSTTSIVSPTPTSAQKWVVSAPSAEPDTRAKQNCDILSTKAASNKRSFMGSSSPAYASKLLNDFALQLELAHRSLVDMSRRLDEHLAQSKRSIASMKSGIPKLVDMVPTSESSTSTTPSFFSGATSSTVTGTVLFPGSASFGSISHVSVLNNAVTSSGSAAMAGNIQHPEAQPIHFGNLQVLTTMQDASSVFSQMPKQYGFHNLSRQTVFRADGTEHSYYRLPENYPLELASPEPVFDVYDDDMDGCSTEFVDMLTTTPEQLTDKEEQDKNLQASKCFSKPTISVEKPPVGTFGVFSLTNEQSICYSETLNDGENYLGRHVQCIQQVLKSVFTSGCATGDVQLPKDYKLNMLLTEERRELWDPGSSTPLHSSNAKPPGELSYVEIMLPGVVTLYTQVGSYVQKLRDQHWKTLNNERRKEWDPRDNTVFSSTLNRVRAQFGVLTSVPQQSCYGRVSSSQENYGSKFLWDPFSLHQMAMMLDKTAVSILVQLLNFIGQPVNLKQLWAQCHFRCNTPNDFLKVQHLCLHIGLDDCPHSDPLQQLGYIMFSSTKVICSARSMSIATNVRMILVLVFGNTIQEENDVVAMYQVFKLQSPMSNTTCIWDPGIESIMFLYKHTRIDMIQLVDCTRTATHACYFLRTALLPPTPMPAYESSNIEAAELTSRCVVFHLHQITNWTSTTSTVIGPFEYGYNMGCSNWQCEFLHQQVVQKYNAKNLLSSRWEMDIIFVTYLPP